MSITFHFICSDGLFRNVQLGRSLAADAVPDSFPIVDYSQVKNHLQQNGLVIDCRFPKQYMFSCIPGSMNLPVNISFIAFRSFIRNLDPEQSIIVYCNSAECQWSTILAKLFYLNGFKNISVYKDGLSEWLIQSGNSMK